MKLVKMKCPNCGANLEMDMSKKKAYCPYCGTRLSIDDEIKTVHIDNAEKVGYDFEKGRQKAHKENRKTIHIVLILAAAAVVFLICINLIKRTDSSQSSTKTDNIAITAETHQNSSKSENVSDHSVSNAVDGVYDASLFEVEDFGLIETSSDLTQDIIKVKCNANGDVLVDGNATAFDASGNALDTALLNRTILKNGETGIVSFDFLKTGIDHIEYTLKYSVPHVSASVISEVEKNATLNDDNIVFMIKNTTDYPLNIQEAFALFFNQNGKLEYYSDAFIGTSGDAEPGEISSGNAICPSRGCKYYQENGNIEYYYEVLHRIDN